MHIIVIIIIIDLEVGRLVETIQMTALLRRARILRRVLETWGDLLSLKLQWKTISYHCCKKNSKGVNNNNNNANNIMVIQRKNAGTWPEKMKKASQQEKQAI